MKDHKNGDARRLEYRYFKVYLAKYLSLMFSGTETLEMSSFVEVATRYLWFTLLSRKAIQFPSLIFSPVSLDHIVSADLERMMVVFRK